MTVTPSTVLGAILAAIAALIAVVSAFHLMPALAMPGSVAACVILLAVAYLIGARWA